MVPTASAMMGLPRKSHREKSMPVQPAMEAMEPRAISTMGTRMGARAFRPPGSLPYSATSCS